MPSRPLSGRSSSLDAVRGLAVALVVGYHYGIGFLSFGDVGVDLFFVLSGYLIGTTLLDNRMGDEFFSTFYCRRAFRILPLYWLLLAASTLSRDQPLWWFLTFYQNFGWVGADRFPVGDPLSVTWSLAIEEQFYLLLPALVRFVPPRWLPRVLWASVVLAPLARWGAFHVSVVAVFLLLPCRLDTLLGGTLIACFQRGSIKSSWLPLALVAPSLDIGLHLVDPSYDPPLMSVIALMFSVFLLLVVRSTKSTFALLRPLCWLGLRAYAIYLFHLPILVLCGNNAALAILVTCVAAFVSGLCIESPLIGFARTRWAYRAMPQ